MVLQMFHLMIILFLCCLLFLFHFQFWYDPINFMLFLHFEFYCITYMYRFRFISIPFLQRCRFYYVFNFQFFASSFFKLLFASFNLLISSFLQLLHQLLYYVFVYYLILISHKCFIIIHDHNYSCHLQWSHVYTVHLLFFH